MELARDQLARLSQQGGQVVVDEMIRDARGRLASRSFVHCRGFSRLARRHPSALIHDSNMLTPQLSGRIQKGRRARAPSGSVCMAERSFADEVKKLRLGAGEVFRGEGILAVTKALLESGVAYVAGYQGAPISHLMDVLADAQDILAELGVHFENSASEATAAATLAASVNYPLRGAVDLQVHRRHQRRLRRAGQPRLGRRHRRRADHRRRGLRRRLLDHAGAQPRLRDEVADLAARPAAEPALHRRRRSKHGFELSRGQSNTPVMLELRIRACHVHGQFIARRQPRARLHACARRWRTRGATSSRIVLPPASFAARAGEDRTSAGRRPCGSSRSSGLNEFFADGADDVGIIVQGGMYNTPDARAASGWAWPTSTATAACRSTC